MITEYIRENAESDWKGCLMLSIPGDITGIIQEFSQKHITDEDLESSGREHYSHCTILYGFDQSVRADDLKPSIDDTNVEIKLGKISRFECEENDVIKIEVINSPHLLRLHHVLKARFQVVTTYPTYNPHVTLAYVKKGACKNLDGHTAFEGMTIPCSEMTFSRGPSDSRTRTPIRYEDFRKKDC